MLAEEKIPYERELYFMVKEMAESKQIYLYELANKLFFNGKWNPESRLTMKDSFIDGVIYQAERCENLDQIYFCYGFLSKVNAKREKEKEQAAI